MEVEDGVGTETVNSSRLVEVKQPAEPTGKAARTVVLQLKIIKFSIFLGIKHLYPIYTVELRVGTELGPCK